MLTIRKAITEALQTGRIDFMADEYAEPGYSNRTGKPILFANWNERTKYNPETREQEVLDSTPRRLGDLAEKAGYALEWSDEWTTCNQCGKAVRTSANSYSWMRSYFEDDLDGEIVCIECVEKDPENYLISLEGESRKAETLGIDLEAHGYRKVNHESYEHGWHPGQNDSPEVIAKSLQARGIGRFIFKLDSVGQFDAAFSVYVHEDERELLHDTAQVESKLPYDPGTEMGKALRGEHSDYYQMTTRTLTPEEFLDGSWARDKK